LSASAELLVHYMRKLCGSQRTIVSILWQVFCVLHGFIVAPL